MKPLDVPRQKEYENLSAFAEITAPPENRALLERCWDVLAGRLDPNNFRQILQRDLEGREFFINDNCWWLYTDSQCNCLGTYGWRPFFNARLRQADLNTWRQFFRHQSDGTQKEPGGEKIVPKGAFPFSMNPGSRLDPQLWVTYYANYFRDDPKTHHPDHDELLDFQLLNLISATDWLLFEHATGTAEEILPQIELFLSYLDGRPKRGELLLVGVQGSQIEFGHGRRRYPASTAFYLLKFYTNLAEIYRMVEEHEKAEAIGERAERLGDQIDEFRMPGGWYVSARGENWDEILGSGLVDGSHSDYFETWPNTAPALLGLFDRERCKAIAERIIKIPPLYANHLMIYNYPARPLEEMDDEGAFPPPGVHVNGGWWWMTAGTGMALFARAGHPWTLRFLAELFEDHDARYTIDYYNEWGANKGRQWPEKRRPDMCSITNLGAFGNFLRATLGIGITHDALEISPALSPEVARLRTKVPIRVAGKEVYLDIQNRDKGYVQEATSEGRPLEIEDGVKVKISLRKLKGRTGVRVVM